MIPKMAVQEVCKICCVYLPSPICNHFIIINHYFSIILLQTILSEFNFSFEIKIISHLKLKLFFLTNSFWESATLAVSLSFCTNAIVALFYDTSIKLKKNKNLQDQDKIQLKLLSLPPRHL